MHLLPPAITKFGPCTTPSLLYLAILFHNQLLSLLSFTNSSLCYYPSLVFIFFPVLSYHMSPHIYNSYTEILLINVNIFFSFNQSIFQISSKLLKNLLKQKNGKCKKAASMTVLQICRKRSFPQISLKKPNCIHCYIIRQISMMGILS